MDYIVSSGFYAKEDDQYKYDFFDIWYKNTIKYSSPKKIFILNHGSKQPKNDNVSWINLDYNLGHMGDIRSGIKSHKLSGWSVSILEGALLAYANNCDMFYKEQDCLAFGDWTKNIYEKHPNEKMVFGHCKGVPYDIEQSLVYIKNEFLLTFVSEYISIEGNDGWVLSEEKFGKIRDKYQKDIGKLDFGYGRIRPFNIEDDIFYIQQVKEKELEMLQKCGKI
jgi:hypothetical protein